MEYEKKYKEALEKAKESLKDDTITNIAISYIESIFPELKEDEDERIRKELIAIFKGEIPYTSEEDAKRYIAWLEKQGDKDELIKELGEYKAKYTQEVLEKHLRVMNKDDERLRKTTISFLKDFADKGYENAVECIDWLEKQSEQKSQGKPALEAINEEKIDNQFCIKPAEWSEEDETSIAVNNPDAYKIGFADGEAHAKEEQWNPSDAQMIALNDVITNGHLSNANERILKGLQKQLRKLKGE